MDGVVMPGSCSDSPPSTRCLDLRVHVFTLTALEGRSTYFPISRFSADTWDYGIRLLRLKGLQYIFN